jgi:hypothetical protein
MGKNAQSRRSVLAQFSVPRLPRQATDHWPIACGNCGKCKVGLRWASRLAYRLRKLRKAPPWPARRASRQKLGWCGKGGNPFFSYNDTKVVPWGDDCDSNAAIADGDTSYCVPSAMACFCCPSTERKKSLADSRSSTRIASGIPHNFQDARSNPASRLSRPATTRVPRSAQREKMARPSSRSTARRQFRGPTGIALPGFDGAHLLRDAKSSENSQSFQCGKASNPGHWCLLIPALCVRGFRS